ncbi:hypothetical protein STTU_p0153 (plasmid) [Streptomyces sp. Tu6071]|uniref:ParB/RepB/Spo0J family partition protein n=1 Tax=Streptomyces sp. Tu6071 TaxID=355249 RepID=UPI00020E6B6B|nr:ParB/RepB/Spo0J family partition protein [Streptomyces sp. Tu6071]EGJ72766.1 hypothetical protein STTU_p0153 [Streptomyces sp. Tu6071]
MPSPTELPPHRISLNPDNPRSSLGDLTDLAGSLKDHGQKQAITVMNRDAYIAANPAAEEKLEPDTAYVVVDGSSRLAAAREAGLTTVKVMVDDGQGGTSEEILESALVANIHRRELSELDEARALQRLLALHGSQRALAARLHRSQPWISTRLALLGLSEEMQNLVGTEKIEHLRAIGNKPAEEQPAALQALKDKESTQRTVRSRKGAATQAADTGERAENDYGVIASPNVPESRKQPAHDYAVITSAPASSSEPPESSQPPRPPQPATPRTAPAALIPVTAIPWRHVNVVHRILREHMTPEDYKALQELMAT